MRVLANIDRFLHQFIKLLRYIMMQCQSAGCFKTHQLTIELYDCINFGLDRLNKCPVLHTCVFAKELFNKEPIIIGHLSKCFWYVPIQRMLQRIFIFVICLLVQSNLLNKLLRIEPSEQMQRCQLRHRKRITFMLYDICYLSFLQAYQICLPVN